MLSAFAVGLALGAQAPAAARSEAPIREVTLPNGARRYAVPISIGGAHLEAGLDTGSTGLRVLPGVLAPQDATPSRDPETYSYSAGARLEGVKAEAMVRVGGLSGRTTLQLIDKVGCVPGKPDCAAGSLPITEYGIQGDGIPGQGFKAILGVNMAHSRIPSLFWSLGARRWIIDLPRPGDEQSGRIILNPTDAEVADYVMAPLDPATAEVTSGLHDAVRGCLFNETTRVRICGPMLFDTGAPGLRVVDATHEPGPWADGGPASLLVMDGSGRPVAGVRVTLGARRHAARLSFEHEPSASPPRIFAGLTPYFAYSILYDPETRRIGLKARPPVEGGPEALSPDSSPRKESR